MRRMPKQPSKVSYRVKLIVKNKKSNDEYSVITVYDRDYLEDSFNFSKAGHEGNEKLIKTGLILNDLKHVGFKITRETTFDSEWFLIEKNGDVEKEFLLRTISNNDEDNMKKEKSLRKEDYERWSREKTPRHSRPLREQFYFRSLRTEKQENGAYRTVSEKIFRCGQNQDFKEIMTSAQDYHFGKVEELIGYDPEQEIKNLQEHSQFEYPIRYSLEIMEIINEKTDRIVNHQWLENNESYHPGVHLDKELRRKYYVETRGRGRRIILDMDLWSYSRK